MPCIWMLLCPPSRSTSVPAIARAAEALGFDAIWSTETMHDPFLPGALVSEHTQRLALWHRRGDCLRPQPGHPGLHRLGPGAGLRGALHPRPGHAGQGAHRAALWHALARFGGGQAARADRSAIRAFWNTWQTGAPLNFRGEYYKLTLMSPFFNPGRSATPISRSTLPG